MPAAQQPSSSAASSTFIIFIRGERVGSEDVALARTADGWTITSSGRIGPPLDLVVREVQVRYTADWKPIELKIDATARDQPLVLRTVVSGTTAVTTFTQAGQPGEQTGRRLRRTPSCCRVRSGDRSKPCRSGSERPTAGSTLQAYSGGVAFPIEVGESSEETIQTASQVIRARRTAAKYAGARDAARHRGLGRRNGRLLRLSVPAQNLEVAREDIASVAARRVTISRANDEQVRVPANGFSLAGTVSKPADTAVRQLPAVILVAGSGPQDRDETVFGIPIFGQLADRLADAGFLVLRYDKRGVGQSGGRIESATLADYADDLRAAVKAGERAKGRRSPAAGGHRPQRGRSGGAAGRGQGEADRGAGADRRDRRHRRGTEHGAGHARARPGEGPAGRTADHDRAAEEDPDGGADRQGLGRHPAGSQASGRHPVVQELSRLRSGEGDGRRQAADSDRPGSAGHAGRSGQRGSAGEAGARAQERRPRRGRRRSRASTISSCRP